MILKYLAYWYFVVFLWQNNDWLLFCKYLDYWWRWVQGGLRGAWGNSVQISGLFFLENIIYFFLVSSRSVVTLPLGKLKAGAAWWRGSGLGVCEASRCCYFFQLNLYLYFHLSLYLRLYLNLEEQYLREGAWLFEFSFRLFEARLAWRQ